MTSPFFVDPLGGHGGGVAQGLAGLGAAFGQQREKQAAEEQQNAAKQAVYKAYQSNDPNQVSAALIQYPEMSKELTGAIGFKNESTKNNAVLTARNIISNPENTEKYLQGRVDYLKSIGADPKDTIEEIEIYKQDPEAYKPKAELLLAGLAPEEYKAWSEKNKAEKTKYEQGKGDLGAYSFNPETNEYTLHPELQATLDASKKEILSKDGELKPGDIKGINDKVTDLTKESLNIKRSADDLIILSKGGKASDRIAAVFKFMKALDPTSAVKQDEQGQVYGATGALSALAGQWNGLIGKGELTDEAFNQIVETSKSLANSAITASSDSVGGYLDVMSDKIPPVTLQKLKGRVPKSFTKYELGQVLEKGGRKYKVIGGDLNNPDVELMP